MDLSRLAEPTFYYFAYGSCMCPVDLKRTFGENTHTYVVGTATLQGYRLGFYRRSSFRNCGVLDIVEDPNSTVEGVLYELPWRFSNPLDDREEVPSGGYRRETIRVNCGDRVYADVRTYVVVNKLPEEIAPNDWYFNVVLRGAVTCGLPEQYCWKLFEHMHQLQKMSEHGFSSQKHQDYSVAPATRGSRFESLPPTSQTSSQQHREQDYSHRRSPLLLRSA